MTDNQWGGKYDGQPEYFAERVDRLAEEPQTSPEFEEYERLKADKMEFGDRKYGTDSWARHDQLEEAMGEMVDLGNYAFLTWRQLKALRDRLDQAGVPRSLSGEDRVGVQIQPFVAETKLDAGIPDWSERAGVPASPEVHEHEADPYSRCPGCREAQWAKEAKDSLGQKAP